MLALSATRDGVEGLTGALLSAATGGGIRLMDSGDQLGVDGIEPAIVDAPRRAMQAKRYGDTSALSQTHLLGEMSRAHHDIPGIDCWVLATTKCLRGKLAGALEGHAESLGWGLVALDWSELRPGAPRFALLCAAFPEIAASWPGLASAAAELDALARRPDFAEAQNALFAELRAADVGFAAARLASAAQLALIHSDASTARMIAGPSPALLAQAPPVAREALGKAANDWWDGGQQVQVLLGLEGMGKTWQALAVGRSLTARPDGPLAVVISAARARRAPDGMAALIAVLSELGEGAGLRLFDADAFWRRRLRCWAAPADGARPRLLVIIDGLDEILPFDWRDWLAPLLVEQWRGTVRLLLTCRDDDWHRGVALHEPRADQICVTPVSRFTPEERDAYLGARGIDPETVSAEVLEAARHPRTAFHLTRMHDELGDLKSVTREQLLLRDFHNRYLVKGGPLDPWAFAAVVRGLAGQAREAALAQCAFTTSAGAVLDAAADLAGQDRSAMRSVLSDLVSGPWLRRDARDENLFTFEDAALPDAVGLALASQLRGLDAEAARAELNRFLEPWGADELVEKVLRTCATALVTDAAVPDALCSIVLARWHERPSHGRAGQDFWRRLHIVRPHLFLDLAPTLGRNGDWLVEWGIACLWEDHESMRPLIQRRLRRWFARVRVPQARPADHLNEDRWLNRDRHRQLRRLRALQRRAPGLWTDRIGIEESEPQGMARLGARTMGFLPRAPFVDILVDWALCCAAAGRLVHERYVELLLRDNPEDAPEALAAVRAAAERLGAGGTELGRKAASYLLRATGVPGDAAGAETLRPLSRRVLRRSALESVMTAAGPRLALRADVALDPQQLIASLWSHVGDPEAEIAESLSEQLMAAAAALVATDVPELFEQDGRSWAVLLRWAPAPALALLRTYLLETPIPAEDNARSRADRDAYRRIAHFALALLEKAECERVATRLEEGAEVDGRGRSFAVAFRLAHAPLDDQIVLLLGTPERDWPSDFHHLLAEPTKGALVRLVLDVDFAGNPAPAVRRLRLALAICHRMEAAPIERAWSQGFACGNEELRTLALDLAFYVGGESAGAELTALGANANAEPNQVRAFAVGAVLDNLGDAALWPLLSRLDPENLAHAYLKRPALRADIAPLWTAWMRDQLLVERRSRSYGGGYHRYPQRQEAYRAYCEDHRDDAVAMVREAWENERLRANISWDHDEGPTWELILALAEDEPDLVKEIWHGSVDNSGAMWVGMIEHFPARLPAGPLFDDLRAEMLTRARTDEQTFEAVRRLEGQGHRAFLIDWISAGLDAPLPIEVARALAVAGFLDASEEAIALWEGPLAAPPGAGWLGDVHAKAGAWFLAARRMRHWYRALAEAPDERRAFGAFWALHSVADARLWLFFRKPPYRVDPTSWRAQWLDLLREETNAVHKRAVRDLGHNRLFEPRPSDILNGR